MFVGTSGRVAWQLVSGCDFAKGEGTFGADVGVEFGAAFGAVFVDVHAHRRHLQLGEEEFVYDAAVDFDEASSVAEGEDAAEQLVFGVREGFDVAEFSHENPDFYAVEDVFDLVGAISAKLRVVFEALPIFDEVHQPPHLLT